MINIYIKKKITTPEYTVFECEWNNTSIVINFEIDAILDSGYESNELMPAIHNYIYDIIEYQEVMDFIYDYLYRNNTEFRDPHLRLRALMSNPGRRTYFKIIFDRTKLNFLIDEFIERGYIGLKTVPSVNIPANELFALLNGGHS